MKKGKKIKAAICVSALIVGLSNSVSAAGIRFADGFFDIFKIKREREEIELEDITPKRGDNSPRGCKEQGDEPEVKDETNPDNGKKHTPRHTEKATEKSGIFDEKRICTFESGSCNWYCKHMKNGERPPMPQEMSFIENLDGYFLGEDEKVIYLTFDAGYENGNIEKILDVLKEEDVKGAFFILENLLRRDTDLVKRMADEGHLVCNHTAKHPDMTKKTTFEEFKIELKTMEDLYRETVGGEIAKYYRPPEGKFNEQNLEWAREMGYKTVFWSYAYADWDNNNQMSPERAREKVISGTHNGEVLLLHPTSSTNAAILSELIKEWKSMGYRFGTLDELCVEKGQ